MDTDASVRCRRSTKIWGTLLLLIGFLWILSASGVVDVEIWRFIGPAALVVVGAWMVWPRTYDA